MKEFTNLIVWILAVFGATNGIAFSSLLQGFRTWAGAKWALLGKLLVCPMCLGFWLGGIASLTVHSPSGNFVADAFLGSCTSWIIYLLIKDKQFGA